MNTRTKRINNGQKNKNGLQKQPAKQEPMNKKKDPIKENKT